MKKILSLLFFLVAVASFASSARTLSGVSGSTEISTSLANSNPSIDAITTPVTLRSTLRKHYLYIQVTEYGGYTAVEFTPGMGAYIYSIEFKKLNSGEDYLFYHDVSQNVASLPFTTSNGQWEIRIVTTGGTTYKGMARFFGPILNAPWPSPLNNY